MPQNTEDAIYMARCLELARQGAGRVAPNPMVGSVIVHGKLITGEGFHRSYGELHAEPVAIGNVASHDLLQHSTIYINLEPCCHHGRTPPCTDLIIEKRIPRVVIGTPDPNPLVAGKGIKLLREKGVEVTVGVLENKCKDLNKRFFTWHLRKRPWIILKWARSSDGFIDLERTPDSPIGPNWITSPTARTLVHKWRAEEQAVLAGTYTILKDNPRLNVRDWTGNDPLRIVIDRNLRLASSHHVFDNSQETLVFTAKNQGHTIQEAAPPKTRYAQIIFDDTAEQQMLQVLHKEKIQSVIIEGGAFTLNRFIEKGLWDEARIFTGPAMFKSGIASPAISGTAVKRIMIDNSLLEIIYNDQPR